MSGFRIEKLARKDAVDAFDCGEEPLNRFLVRYAFQNQQANASQTYVGLSGEDVIGFYTFVVGGVAYEGAVLHPPASTEPTWQSALRAVPCFMLGRCFLSPLEPEAGRIART